MSPDLPVMSPNLPVMSPSLPFDRPVMSPADAVDEIEMVNSNAKRIVWKRFMIEYSW